MTAKSMQAHNVGVAIVAPGGYAPDETALARGIACLQAQGCQVRSYCDPAAKHQRFGGTDEAQVEAGDAVVIETPGGGVGLPMCVGVGKRGNARCQAALGG